MRSFPRPTSTMSCPVQVLLSLFLLSQYPLSSASSTLYGQQCSFPITNRTLDGCDPSMLDRRQAFYHDYMEGCYRHYDEESCEESEQDRLEMNERQPQSMVNFTSTGYRKVKAPAPLMKILTEFWETNRDRRQVEAWGEGSIYTNHWKAPTYLVNVEDEELEGAGVDLKDAIWNAAKDGVEEWTGGAVKLRPSSLYGIRVYTKGAVLNPHCDRIPLISSAIINVDQNVSEPWPLEVYDRQGNAVNVTMEPGDMVLYESHSLIHGRPFALNGEFMANVFVHFEPYDMNPETGSDATRLLNPGGELPPYVLPDSPAAKLFRESNPEGWSKYFSEQDSHPKCNVYAAKGMLNELQELAKLDRRLLHFEAANGRTPLHEAIHAGQTEVVLYLLHEGVDIDKRTDEGEGASPLNIARTALGMEHEISVALAQRGAKDIWSELDGDDEEEEESGDILDEEDDDSEEENDDNELPSGSDEL